MFPLYYPMATNIQKELALKCINHTNISLFLTGKAGTGKTTFLKSLKDNCVKRFVVVAPTGIAAINAGGVTIHSFFQLPPEPYLPDVPELRTEYQTIAYRKMQKFKAKLMKDLELLVIDEVSMVRADLLDAISDTLKRMRHSEEPFGGVQLLLIGDLYQLPPVVTEREQQYMNRVYKSPFFFSSKALRKLITDKKLEMIELQTIYRQQDPVFINILNKFRDNKVDIDTLRAINQRVFQDVGDSIILTTHNNMAQAINEENLHMLDSESHIYDARIEGEFPESMMPMDKSIEVREGEKVMFIKNDSSADRRYYNGKIGYVIGFDRAPGEKFDSIVVKCEGDDKEILVGRECWENVKYVQNPGSNEIEQITVGMFEQYPLKPAWAVTIHKAQGLTFDKVTIDAGHAFAFGQVYVALSRCRTLEGLSLETPIKFSNVFTNQFINNFFKYFADTEATVRHICEAAGDNPITTEENVARVQEMHWVH